MDNIIPELIVTSTLYVLILGFNKRLQNINFYLIASIIVISIIVGAFYLFKLKFAFLIIPLTLIIIFQPTRFLFKKYLQREPILHARGIYLTPEEEDIIAFPDYVFTAVLIVIPLLSPLFCI